MHIFRQYPRQFWLLFLGFVINRTSNGLIWPFLTIYIRRQLDISLTTVALLLSVQAVSGLISTSIIGALMDRFGRKRIIVVCLFGYAAVLVGMRGAETVESWAILIAFYGMMLPVFTVGANAMVADLVQAEQRASAYALIRTGQNIGTAVGPAIGGLLISGVVLGGELVMPIYGLTYYITALVNIGLAIMLIFVLRETLPERKSNTPAQPPAGYGRLLTDRTFMAFCGTYILIEMVNTLVFMLLSVYSKENFGIPEGQYGFIVTINALMVVFFQYLVTRVTVKYRPLHMMALGAVFYCAGALSIGLSQNFGAFAFSMVIVTIGELIVSPTGLTLVARLAPAHMRARYMGVYALTWTIASGIAPVMGGLLNDYIAPAAIWYGGAIIGLVATVSFVLMAQARMAGIEPETVPVKPILQDG